MSSPQQLLKPLVLELLRLAHHEQNAFFLRLPAANLAAIGKPDAWEAKDHVIHLAFGQQIFVNRVEALLQNKPEPSREGNRESAEALFERQRTRSWSDILAESDRTYADLIALAERANEEQLMASGTNGFPLFISFITICYEHTPVHLAQYLVEHGDPAGEIPIYDAWLNKALATALPDTIKGVLRYNQACFYATRQRVAQAQTFLEEAFTFHPAMREFSRNDPDLAALRAAEEEHA